MYELNDDQESWVKEVNIDDLKAKLNLGCGRKHMDGFINIDKNPDVDPDYIIDIEKDGLLHIETSSVDMIFCQDFVEHISSDGVVFVMDEIYRVLKPDGIFEAWIPSTDGRGAFQDPTHKSFWNMNSWLYYSNDTYRRSIGTKARFCIQHIEDIMTHADFKIIHTHVIATALKED